VKVRDLIQRLEAAGWQLKRSRGSHRQFRHPHKEAVVTVAGHPGKDVPVGTLKAILRSAGLEEREKN
jgi:predicted RNA binding protein YcfA (HicA-like mRNA interferase family)